MHDELLISAILPTRNRVGLLNKALWAIAGQTLERSQFEVIVVDDGSTDETPIVIKQFEGIFDLKYVYQDGAGISEAKNRGLKEVGSPLVVFLDDDDVCSPTLLEEHVATHRANPDLYTAVLGRTDLCSEARTSPLMHFATEVGCYLFSYGKITDGQVLNYSFFWGGRSSCKTKLLADYGVFRTDFKFGCEDIELGYRLSHEGLKVIYNAHALSTMIRVLTYQQFCGRVERQGRSNFKFAAMHPTEEIRKWGDVVDAGSRWEAIKGRFSEIVQTGNRLDEMARLRVEEGLPIGDFLTKQLHQAYWDAFDACRLKGTAEAEQYGLATLGSKSTVTAA